MWTSTLIHHSTMFLHETQMTFHLWVSLNPQFDCIVGDQHQWKCYTRSLRDSFCRLCEHCEASLRGALWRISACVIGLIVYANEIKVRTIEFEEQKVIVEFKKVEAKSGETQITCYFASQLFERLVNADLVDAYAHCTVMIALFHMFAAHLCICMRCVSLGNANEMYLINRQVTMSLLVISCVFFFVTFIWCPICYFVLLLLCVVIISESQKNFHCCFKVACKSVHFTSLNLSLV